MKQNIGIIDYGAGNLRSVLNAFESLNLKARLAAKSWVNLTRSFCPASGLLAKRCKG